MRRDPCDEGPKAAKLNDEKEQYRNEIIKSATGTQPARKQGRSQSMARRVVSRTQERMERRQNRRAARPWIAQASCVLRLRCCATRSERAKELIGSLARSFDSGLRPGSG